MTSTSASKFSTILILGISIAGMLLGAGFGALAGIEPIIPVGIIVIVITPIYFLSNPQQCMLALLVLRSSLDSFSALQIPTLFGMGLNILVILYLVVALFKRQVIHTDMFWWFLIGWIFLQGLWVILVPLGGVGFDASDFGGAYFDLAVREWIRLFSWATIYLMIMQLKGKVSPETVISVLFMALCLPFLIALLQTFVPSVLPPQFASGAFPEPGSLKQVSRIRGTLGHPNSFATFLFLFIGLTYWKITHSPRRWFWLVMMGLLVFFYSTAQALFSLMMLGVLIVVLIAPRLNLLTILGGIGGFTAIISLFGSTEFGQKRLDSISGTPLLNPSLGVDRAILMAKYDNNSFNWRLAQWDYLLKASQDYPLMGFGLGSSTYVSANNLLPHNDYVRALIEGGQVGIVCYFVFLIGQVVWLSRLIVSSPKGSKQRSFCYTLLAMFLAIPVGMITENIWSHTVLFFYWFTLVAIAGWDWESTASNDSSSLITHSTEPT